jgi:hypothetical protein
MKSTKLVLLRILIPEYREKITDMLQVIDKPYDTMLYRVYLAWAGFKLTTLVVIGTDSVQVRNIVDIKSFKVMDTKF